jgi:hypothetical protein
MSNSLLDTGSGSVLTETQLLSLLKEYERLLPMRIAIPDTRTSGEPAMLVINLSVWPPSTQKMIRQQLLRMGGVPLESPPPIVDYPGKSYVLRAMKAVRNSTVLRAEHATGVVDLGPNLT